MNNTTTLVITLSEIKDLLRAARRSSKNLHGKIAKHHCVVLKLEVGPSQKTGDLMVDPLSVANNIYRLDDEAERTERLKLTHADFEARNATRTVPVPAK